MDVSKLSKRLYDAGGFLLVDGLVQGSEFGLDGQVWQASTSSSVTTYKVADQ